MKIKFTKDEVFYLCDSLTDLARTKWLHGDRNGSSDCEMIRARLVANGAIQGTLSKQEAIELRK